MLRSLFNGLHRYSGAALRIEGAGGVSHVATQIGVPQCEPVSALTGSHRWPIAWRLRPQRECLPSWTDCMQPTRRTGAVRSRGRPKSTSAVDVADRTGRRTTRDCPAAWRASCSPVVRAKCRGGWWRIGAPSPPLCRSSGVAMMPRVVDQNVKWS